MTRLSNRQYPMLAAFADRRDDYRMSLKEAHAFDQRPFGSMLSHGWIVYKRGQGFAITKEGREAWHEFNSTDIARKNPARPLSHYFDPLAYGLREEVRSKKALRIVRHNAA